MPAKCAITLHSSTSITDQVKINEQNKSIGTGSLNVQTELNLPAERYGEFEPQYGTPLLPKVEKTLYWIIHLYYGKQFSEK